jgi:hypothetical protein
MIRTQAAAAYQEGRFTRRWPLLPAIFRNRHNHNQSMPSGPLLRVTDILTSKTEGQRGRDDPSFLDSSILHCSPSPPKDVDMTESLDPGGAGFESWGRFWEKLRPALSIACLTTFLLWATQVFPSVFLGSRRGASLRLAMFLFSAMPYPAIANLAMEYDFSASRDPFASQCFTICPAVCPMWCANKVCQDVIVRDADCAGCISAGSTATPEPGNSRKYDFEVQISALTTVQLLSHCVEHCCCCCCCCCCC